MSEHIDRREETSNWARLLYVVNVRGLADGLAQQQVPNWIQCGYLIPWTLVSCNRFLLVAPRIAPADGHVLRLESLASVIIIIVGVFLCFRLNSKGDDGHFLTRLVCLGAVVGMRLFLFVVLPTDLMLNVVRGAFEHKWGYSLDVFFVPITQVLYFWRLRHWIGVVATRNVHTGSIGSEPPHEAPSRDLPVQEEPLQREAKE